MTLLWNGINLNNHLTDSLIYNNYNFYYNVIIINIMYYVLCN